MEENQTLSVSEMIRITNENSSKFWIEVADHIERLEAVIIELNNRIIELEDKSNEA